MSDIMEKIIADLIKGAAESEGFLRGGKVNVEIGRDRGHETKLAGLGGGLGGALGPLGAAAGAGLQDKDTGSAVGGGLGALAGNVLGMPAGAIAGGMVGVPVGMLVNLMRGESVGQGAAAGGMIGGSLGGLAGIPLGGILGGHMGQNRFREGAGEKRAHNYGGIGGAIGPLGAAIGADSGHKLDAFGGSLLGMLGGGAIGSAGGGALGALLKNPGLGAALGGNVGAMAGSIYGGHRGGEPDPSLLDRLKGGALEDRYTDGVKAAAETFHVKGAFLGALAAKALPAIMGAAKSPIGQQALGMGAQMGVQKLMTPREPQQMG